MSGDRARLYAKRQEVLERGPVVPVVPDHDHRHPRMWQGDVQALHALLVSDGRRESRSRPSNGAGSRKLFG